VEKVRRSEMVDGKWKMVDGRWKLPACRQGRWQKADGTNIQNFNLLMTNDH